jgi:hypothetical protein
MPLSHLAQFPLAKSGKRNRFRVQNRFSIDEFYFRKEPVTMIGIGGFILEFHRDRQDERLFGAGSPVRRS